MEAIKKNLVSIIFGAVALLAVVAGVAYPIPGMFDDLTAKLTARKKDYAEIDRLLKLRRPIPTVQVDSKEARTLDGYPNDGIIKWAKDQIGAVKDQADKMYLQALDIDDRLTFHVDQGKSKIRPGLLVNDPGTVLLPNPDGSARVRFRDRYDEELKSFFAPGAKPGDKPGKPGLLYQKLNAAIPPTPEEIKDEMKRIEDAWMARKMIGPGGAVQNEDDIKKGMAEEQAQVSDRLKNAQAMDHMLYINPDRGLCYHAGMAKLLGRELPTPVDIWWAQLGYWIQYDIVKAIVDTNANAKAKSVHDSIVKHVLEVYIPDQFLTASGASGLGAGAPPPAMSRSGVPIAPAGDPFRASATGRVSNPPGVNNPLYDVVQFRVIVVVDEQRMGTFLAELSRDRLLNIVEMDVAAEDRSVAQASGFMYGNASVVRLTLRCEALFMRGWTVRLMPPEIRQLLGIDPAAR